MPSQMPKPAHYLLIDIDGLRPDIFSRVLGEEKLPNLARLLGGPSLERGVLNPVLAPAPSITFTSQACLFTGTHPNQHGIPGNQFFDRFGTHSDGVPRHYAFDVGDTLSADDAVRVFTDGLASRCLGAPTLYQKLTEQGWQSLVAGHMYAAGAETWLRPSLVDLARFTKGGNLFGLSAPEFDRRMLENLLDELAQGSLPEIITIYFMGVDHESHHHGPQAQVDYLVEHLDPIVSELWDALISLSPSPASIFTAIFSDHGQISVPADDQHSIRLAFPFERELGHLFDALGLDVHDYPGEDPNCDAVVASNGGLAHIYLRNRRGGWADPPDFTRDVLSVGRAFWEAHASGRYAPEIKSALAGVLVRDVTHGNWEAPYQALTPSGAIVPLVDWFTSQPSEMYVDPVHRLDHLAGKFSGDLLLISDYAAGFYFAGPVSGVHGGLHPQDSWATLAFGWPGIELGAWEDTRIAIQRAIDARCQNEGGRYPSTTDLLTGLSPLLPLRGSPGFA